MFLSDTIQVVDFLNNFARNALISNYYRSFGGTLIKLFGAAQVSGIYFNLKEKLIFPVTDLSLFPKEPITKTEEGLRSNFYGRIVSFSVMSQFGKVVKIENGKLALIVPLFNGKSVRITDEEGVQKWILKPDKPLNLLQKPMKDFPLTFKDPLLWERFFVEKAREEKREQQRLLLEKKRQKIVSTINILKRETERHKANALLFSRNGALIKANLYLFDSSAHKNSLVVSDFDGKQTEIFLNPAKTVLQNMEHFFAGIKKAKNGIQACEARVDFLKNELIKLNDTNELSDEKGKERVAFNVKKKQNSHVPYREFHSENGKIFLVGKEDRDNDELTFKISMPHDLWFHAKDYSGSHVIMKMKKGEVAKREDILIACALAIIYSKAKKSGCGEVWFTERKNVMKKRGMAPGAVTFKNAKSIYMSNVTFPKVTKL